MNQAAQSYLSRGLSVIPLNGKIPAIKWKAYQKTLATEAEAAKWYEGTDKNIGIVTGWLSGLAVVDFDTEEAYQDAKKRGLPHGPTVKTGRGYHLYCQHLDGLTNFQKRDDLPGIDLRAEGGQVVAPPSMHQNGKRYEWLVTLDEATLPAVPEWLIAKPTDKKPVKDLYTGSDTGSRNDTLARLVGSWVNAGGDHEEILQQALLWNQANTPPMSQSEVEKTVKSIFDTHHSNKPLDIITDMRVAELFAQEQRDVARWWPQAKKWLINDGTRWASDSDGGAFPLLKKLIGGMYEAGRALPDDATKQHTLKGIVALEGHRRQETILAAASVVPAMIINSSRLDNDPMALNVLNGTIDLSTGKLRPHNPDDFITRVVNINFDLDAQCPEFFKFLNRVMGGQKELVEYMQRYLGYCLTGKTTEQILLFLYGTGANGKTTLANIIEKLLGDFAATSDSSLLMQRDNRSASNDLAGLRGSRLVKVSEFDDGERLAEATIKTLTGGDRISCRFLYGEYFEYTPQYKILLIGNYKPKVRGRDHGIWRRIHLLPFRVTIPEAERDPDLMDKLTAELPGILSWAVQGCLEWQKVGLQAPAEIRNEVEAYRHSEDIFSQWLEECCELGDQHRSTSRGLLDSFKEFSGWRNLSSTKFGRLLKENGFIKEKSNVVYWRGLNVALWTVKTVDTVLCKPSQRESIGDFTGNGLNCPTVPNHTEERPQEIEWEDRA